MCCVGVCRCLLLFAVVGGCCLLIVAVVGWLVGWLRVCYVFVGVVVAVVVVVCAVVVIVLVGGGVWRL